MNSSQGEVELKFWKEIIRLTGQIINLRTGDYHSNPGLPGIFARQTGLIYIPTPQRAYLLGLDPFRMRVVYCEAKSRARHPTVYAISTNLYRATVEFLKGTILPALGVELHRVQNLEEEKNEYRSSEEPTVPRRGENW